MTSTAYGQTPKKVKPSILLMYVHAAGPADGLIDAALKGRRESVSHLETAIDDRGRRFLDAPDGSAIDIEVTDRRVVGETDEDALAVPIGKAVVVAPRRGTVKSLTAKMRVGAITREFTATGTGSWVSVANSLGKEIRAFLKDNDTRIRQEMAKKHQN